VLHHAVQVRVGYQALLKHTVITQDARRLREEVVWLHDPVKECGIEGEGLPLAHPAEAVRRNKGQALHKIQNGGVRRKREEQAAQRPLRDMRDARRLGCNSE
jgi:hypothetical protein